MNILHYLFAKESFDSDITAEYDYNCTVTAITEQEAIEIAKEQFISYIVSCIEDRDNTNFSRLAEDLNCTVLRLEPNKN